MNTKHYEKKKHEVRAGQILEGDRRALAKAITLVESGRADHLGEAEALFALLAPHSGKSIRLGLSGPPGAGKSTFIEAFGNMLISLGHKVAVLAVDPSSRRSGGSILGDKTRMSRLARNTNAFIRPSPSGGLAGGVARRTRESILLVEAAGFDVVIVETVGVGQSETAVADMVDALVLIMSPGAGDELQGIKRGIMEMADLVLVNKADGDLRAPATRAASEIESAFHYLSPKTNAWTPKVQLVSALTGAGIELAWSTIEQFRAAMAASGELARLRRAQTLSWFHQELTLEFSGAVSRLAKSRLVEAEREVLKGHVLPPSAARNLVGQFLSAGT